jgi:formate-dependent phosphoribosylglycinamide formyltransferase (GAR transformylase)
MILGSSEEFEDLVQLAVRQGIYTVVCDGYRGNPAKKWADRAYDENIFDVEAVAEICRRERVDHILTAYSDVLFEQTV